MIPVVEMREVEVREVNRLVWSHTAGKEKNQESTPSLPHPRLGYLITDGQGTLTSLSLSPPGPA